jgi:hypothetical protein
MEILLTGQQKIIDLRLKDATLGGVNKTSLGVKSSFDLQPVTFLVRASCSGIPKGPKWRP